MHFLLTAIALIVVIFIIYKQNKSEKKANNLPNNQEEESEFISDEEIKPITRIEIRVNNNKLKPKRKKSNYDPSLEEYYEEKLYDSEYLYPKENIDKIHNFFARKKIVITGDFVNFLDRNTLAETLWELGADLDKGVTEHTNILLSGENPGPEKTIKAKNFIEEGYSLTIMQENEFIEELDKALQLENDKLEDKTEFMQQSFYITGKFKHFFKSNIKLIIQDRGGEVLSRLSTKTTILLIGEEPDFELIEKAEKWNESGKTNITFSNEEDFLKLAFPDQTFEFEKPIGPKPFNKKKVYIAGKIFGFTDEHLKETIILLGGIPAKNLSKKTNIIIKGIDIDESKEQKINELAKSENIIILTGKQFKNILKRATKKTYKFKKNI